MTEIAVETKKIDIISIPGPLENKIRNHKNGLRGMDLIKLNNRLIKLLNPNYKVVWHLGFLEKHYSDDFKTLSSNEFEFHSYIYTEKEIQVRYPEQPSSQHGKLLNLVYSKLINTESDLVIIDPDFFIIKYNWIDLVKTYLVTNQKSFFGAPHNLDRIGYYQGFPTVYFLYIDNKFLKSSLFDFMPNENQYRFNKELNVFEFYNVVERFNLQRKITLLRLANFYYKFISFGDTGYKIHKQYKRSKLHGTLTVMSQIDLLLSLFPKQKRFNSELYLYLNADVKEAGVDPKTHYKKFGKKEGRSSGSGLNKRKNFGIHTAQIMENRDKFLSISKLFTSFYFLDDFFSVHLGHNKKDMRLSELEHVVNFLAFDCKFDSYHK